MISAFAHIIDVHAQRDAVYTPSNVGLNIDQRLCCTLNIYYAKDSRK
jgi:hypothetical protein